MTDSVHFLRGVAKFPQAGFQYSVEAKAWRNQSHLKKDQSFQDLAPSVIAVYVAEMQQQLAQMYAKANELLCNP